MNPTPLESKNRKAEPKHLDWDEDRCGPCEYECYERWSQDPNQWIGIGLAACFEHAEHWVAGKPIKLKVVYPPPQMLGDDPEDYFRKF